MATAGETIANALYHPDLRPGVDFVGAGVGTGIGTSRAVWRYVHGELVLIVLEGEGGHLEVRTGEQGLKHACGQYDCLEIFAGGAGIKSRFEVTTEEDFARVDWRSVGDDLGAGMQSMLTAHAGAGILVLGGGVVDNQPQLMRHVEGYLGEHLLVTGQKYRVLPSIFIGEKARHPSLAAAVLHRAII